MNKEDSLKRLVGICTEERCNKDAEHDSEYCTYHRFISMMETSLHSDEERLKLYEKWREGLKND